MADISKINFKGVEYDIKPLMDATPTQGSTNAVSSGGVWNAIQDVNEDIHALLKTAYTGKDIYTTPVATDKTHNGITYTWNGSVCTVSGTATNTSFCNFIGSTTVMPSAYHAGGYYLITVNSTDPNICLRVSTGISGDYIAPDFYNGIGLLHIPDNATYLLMRYQVYKDKTVNGTISAEIHELLPVPYAEIPIVDTIPTQGSSNAVSSGGVYETLDGLQAQIPQIDSTISQSGQAADAKTVGMWVEALRKSAYTGEDIYSTPIAANKTHNGITYTWNGSTCTVSGTASDTSFCNFIGSTTVMPSALRAGGYYLITVNSTDPNVLLRVSTGTSIDYIIPDFYNGTGLLHIPDDVTYCVMRYQVYKGYTVNGIISAEIHEILPIPKGLVGTYLAPSTGDRASEIEALLSTYGICRLGKGDYIIGNLIMPDGSIIVGESDATKIYFDENAIGSAITLGSRCTIQNITLFGASADIALPTSTPTITERHGIEWTGELVEKSIISGCRIERFAGSGIYMHDTTTDVDQNLAISNCLIRNCVVGLYIRKNSEFHKIDNCSIVKNYYGILNRGGNNNISNCGIDGNTIGIQIDMDEGTNGGHGAITGCSINHSGGNTGYGLIIKTTGREIVSNCSLYYSKVLLQSTDGNVISNCGIGNNATIEINTSSNKCNIIANCMFRNSGSIINTSGNTKVLNCWNREGTAITI